MPGRVMSNLKTHGLRDLLSSRWPRQRPPSGRPLRFARRQRIPRQRRRPEAAAPWAALPADHLLRSHPRPGTSGHPTGRGAGGGTGPGERDSRRPPRVGRPGPAVPGGQRDPVVLTRQSSLPPPFASGREVSFPSGRLDPGEDALANAPRETSEEIGLDPADVEIARIQLGRLMTVSSASLMTPFVGALVTRPVLHPNPAEVELAGCGAGRSGSRRGAHDRDVGEPYPERAVHFFDLPYDIVWGATKRVLHDLLMLVLGRVPGPHEVPEGLATWCPARSDGYPMATRRRELARRAGSGWR